MAIHIMTETTDHTILITTFMIIMEEGLEMVTKLDLIINVFIYLI